MFGNPAQPTAQSVQAGDVARFAWRGESCVSFFQSFVREGPQRSAGGAMKLRNLRQSAASITLNRFPSGSRSQIDSWQRSGREAKARAAPLAPHHWIELKRHGTWTHGTAGE